MNQDNTSGYICKDCQQFVPNNSIHICPAMQSTFVPYTVPPPTNILLERIANSLERIANALEEKEETEQLKKELEIHRDILRFGIRIKKEGEKDE